MLATVLFLSLLPAQPLGKCVLDEAHALKADEYNVLESMCENMDKSGDGQFEVLVTDDFRGDEKEEFSNKVFQQWQIGHKGRNDGLLILLSPKMRKWRIEVGYGLEGRITDAHAARVGQQFGVPAWKAGRWGEGLIAVANQIAPMMHAEAKTMAPVQHNDNEDAWLIILFLVLGMGVVALIAWLIARREEERTYVPLRRIEPATRVVETNHHITYAPTPMIVPVPVRESVYVEPKKETKRRDDTPPSSSSYSSYDSGSSGWGGGGSDGGGFSGGDGGMSGGGGAGGDF